MEPITVIIETPKGKNHKIDFDPVLGRFKLNKVMPAGLSFPFDFGYIPETVGGDGDPLDVMVISEVESFPGCAVDCRLIGGLKAEQRERNGDQMRNDRLIAIPVVSVQYAAVKNLSQLPAGVLDQIEHFFRNYNHQANKEFNVKERLNVAEAKKLIEKSRVKESQNILIQLMLPLYKPTGERFPSAHYTSLHKELTEKFGGLTAYNRAPAEGFWKASEGHTIKEDILVYEVMAKNLDVDYWSALKTSLLKKFDQDELMIISSSIRRL